MPRALDNFCRLEEFEPVLVRSDVLIPSSRQITHRLLCQPCENLLSQRGETWVIPRLARFEGGFPLVDLLLQQAPINSGFLPLVYSATKNPNIQRNKLIHFAIGIFWKASVHSWGAGISEPHIDLGSGGEALRRFLLEEQEFTPNLALTVSVTPPSVQALPAFSAPERGSNPDLESFYFNVPGLFFNLYVGEDIRARMGEFCLVSNPLGPIIMADMNAEVIDLFMGAATTARKPRKLIEIREAIEKRGLRCSFKELRFPR